MVGAACGTRDALRLVREAGRQVFAQRVHDILTLIAFAKDEEHQIRKVHLAPKRLHQLIGTFLNMARDLGTATIAEGIECSEEGETCRRLGFDFAQGFFYGNPIPISQFAPPTAPIKTMN